MKKRAAVDYVFAGKGVGLGDERAEPVPGSPPVTCAD